MTYRTYGVPIQIPNLDNCRECTRPAHDAPVVNRIGRFTRPNPHGRQSRKPRTQRPCDARANDRPAFDAQKFGSLLSVEHVNRVVRLRPHLRSRRERAYAPTFQAR